MREEIIIFMYSPCTRRNPPILSQVKNANISRLKNAKYYIQSEVNFALNAALESSVTRLCGRMNYDLRPFENDDKYHMN